VVGSAIKDLENSSCYWPQDYCCNTTLTFY